MIKQATVEEASSSTAAEERASFGAYAFASPWERTFCVTLLAFLKPARTRAPPAGRRAAWEESGNHMQPTNESAAEQPSANQPPADPRGEREGGREALALAQSS